MKAITVPASIQGILSNNTTFINGRVMVSLSERSSKDMGKDGLLLEERGGHDYLAGPTRMSCPKWP